MRYKNALATITIASAIAATTTHLRAEEVQFDKLGMSVFVPDGWKQKFEEEPGRTTVLFQRPIVRKDKEVIGCLVNRLDQPGAFERYSQAQLNEAYEKKPMGRLDWLAQFQDHGMETVTDLDFGKSSLSGDPACWSIMTTTQQENGRDFTFIMKTILSQTPHYAWNLHCTVMASGVAKAKNLYQTNEAVFERVFESFRHQ